MRLKNLTGRLLMRRWHNAVLAVSFCMVGLWVTPASGYVLTGPHILDLMVRKLAGGKRLQVDQMVTLEDPTIAGGPVELQETLRFVFPNRFRSDMRLENTQRIYVSSQGRSLTVVDGIIKADGSARFNRYKDLFLYNSRIALHKILVNHGVDVGVSSLGRLDDRIVFVIGANYPDDSVSQVWVDKDQFVPLRWINIIPSGNMGIKPERLDFVYDKWQQLDGVWYPMEINTYHNESPIRKIRVTKVKANPIIAEKLFDIPLLETTYKKEVSPSPDAGVPSTDMDEVQRTLEDFRKKFDP